MMAEIEMTPSQAVAKSKIQKFLKSNHRVFRLTGAAGYGKTTVIKWCLEDLLTKDYAKRGYGGTPNVLGIALAHKAKNVLRGSIHNVSTFAKAYGYKEVILDNGDRKFEPAKFHTEPPMGHWDIPVFVFDEVSMFNQRMIDIMLKETPPNSKIILMGDQAQLPPPGGDDRMLPDQDSPIFYMNLPEECYHELTEPVRQKLGNPILDLAYAIRAEIFAQQDLGKVMQAICTPKMIDGFGTQIMKEPDVIDLYIKNGDFTNNKIITYKKDTVTDWNNKIRNIVFNHPEENLINDDIIFLTNNFSSWKPKFSLNNADEYIVEKVQKSTFRVQGYDVESYFAFIPNSDYNFPVYVVTPTKVGKRTYDLAMRELGANAKAYNAWKPLYNFKDSFTEFTMGYCINAYRSQGSTYRNVYFDLMDVIKLHGKGVLTDKRFMQTVYTVITRASQSVTFIQ